MSAWFTQAAIWSALMAPALRATSRPSLSRMSAGMEDTPRAALASGASSALSFRKRTLGSIRWAAAANCGAMARQGPHQGAQTSTSTGRPWLDRR